MKIDFHEVREHAYNAAVEYLCSIHGCLTTDAFAGFCLLICLTDSNEPFLVVILVLSYLLVSLVPY
jgi:hypothetical protein